LININFSTAELIYDKTSRMIKTSIQQVVHVYQARSFWFLNISGDGGFECVRNLLSEMGITLYVTSRNEHVPKIEIYIRSVKERVQSIRHTLPLKNYLPRIISEVVYNAVFWLNSFPHTDGVHATTSPRTLLMELAIDYHKLF